MGDSQIPIAKLPPLKDDFKNNFKKYASWYVQLGAHLLFISCDELKVRYGKEEVIDYFQNSILFQDEDKEYLSRSISAYWENDFLVASHLFCPLIETAIGELIRMSGRSIMTLNKIGGFDRIPLTTLLINHQEVFDNVYQSGEDVLLYFRLVLTEKLGMNLRNDFAHGLGKRKFHGREASDRLFHILCWLSLLKIKKMSVR